MMLASETSTTSPFLWIPMAMELQRCSKLTEDFRNALLAHVWLPLSATSVESPSALLSVLLHLRSTQVAHVKGIFFMRGKLTKINFIFFSNFNAPLHLKNKTVALKSGTSNTADFGRYDSKSKVWTYVIWLETLFQLRLFCLYIGTAKKWW